MYQSASRVPEAAHQSRPQCPEAADLSGCRSVLVDSPPRPLAAKRGAGQMSTDTPLDGGSAWESDAVACGAAGGVGSAGKDVISEDDLQTCRCGRPLDL
jgi:hypothetical protein